MAQSFLRTPTVERLSSILEDLHRGRLRIPSFQRPFRWTDDQRLMLLDSIRQGLPIGSFMVWRTTSRVAHDPDIGPFQLAYPMLRDGETRQYLLDGRQRLTTLYAVLGEALYAQEAVKSTPSVLYDAEDWYVFYDLAQEQFVLKGSRNDIPKTWMPANLLIDSFSRQVWLAKNIGTASQDRVLWNRANSLSAHFNDYLIPVIPIVSDNIEQVSLSFKRVNQGGTDMGDFDMVHALTWSNDFDFGQRVSAAIETIEQSGWGDLDRDWILKAITAEIDLNPFRFDSEELSKKLKADTQAVDRVSRHILDAISFLSRVGIRGPGSIPYTHQFLFLTRIFGKISYEHMSVQQQEQLRDWIWLTSITSFLGGAGHDRLTKHWSEFEAWIVSSGPRPAFYPQAPECRRYNFGHARSRILSLTLAHMAPRHVDLRSTFDPFDSLARHGKDAMPMLLAQSGAGLTRYDRERLKSLSNEVRSNPANRFLVPAGFLPVFRDYILNLSLRRNSSPGLSTMEEEFIKSHAIPIEALDRLRSFDYTGFIEERRKLLLDMERHHLKHSGIKIQDDGPLTEPLR